MTDIEIDKALALAIGWKRMLPNPEVDGLKRCWVWAGSKWRLFSHKDWNVIGPIAARYNTFPIEDAFGRWFSAIGTQGKNVSADTPQEAIALAVIEGANHD